jgi:hypothetical protein
MDDYENIIPLEEEFDWNAMQEAISDIEGTDSKEEIKELKELQKKLKDKYGIPDLKINKSSIK